MAYNKTGVPVVHRIIHSSAHRMSIQPTFDPGGFDFAVFFGVNDSFTSLPVLFLGRLFLAGVPRCATQRATFEGDGGGKSTTEPQRVRRGYEYGASGAQLSPSAAKSAAHPLLNGALQTFESMR